MKRYYSHFPFTVFRPFLATMKRRSTNGPAKGSLLERFSVSYKHSSADDTLTVIVTDDAPPEVWDEIERYMPQGVKKNVPKPHINPRLNQSDD